MQHPGISISFFNFVLFWTAVTFDISERPKPNWLSAYSPQAEGSDDGSIIKHPGNGKNQRILPKPGLLAGLRASRPSPYAKDDLPGLPASGASPHTRHQKNRLPSLSLK
jgi:hypothetical protein